MKEKAVNRILTVKLCNIVKEQKRKEIEKQSPEVN
jgi:hypothetical protein